MLFEIKHRHNKKILFSLECESYKICVETAIKMKIDLRNADLSSMDLSFANLRLADLRYVNLNSANLNSADLSFTNLYFANLSSTNLSSANLVSADLRYANLSSADLRHADLSSADLRFADLRSTNLIQFRYKKEYCFYTFDDSLRIGCLVMPISEWSLRYKEIGEKYSYNEDEIEMYGNFIKMCENHYKRSFRMETISLKSSGSGDGYDK